MAPVVPVTGVADVTYGSRVRRPPLLPSLAALTLAGSLLAAAPAAQATPGPSDRGDRAERLAQADRADRAAAPARAIDHTQWDGGAQFRRGTMAGTRFSDGRVSIKQPTGTRSFGGRTYDRASWTSPWTTPGMSYTELIASWSATTPGDSWIEVRVRGRNARGTTSSWDVAGRWASGDRFVKRQTDSAQDDDLATVSVDTWKAKSALKSFQLDVTLLRRAGTKAATTLDAVGAMTSRLTGTAGATSAPGTARGTVLDVPRYSQMIHRGHYPAYGNGGEAWCSPTSTARARGRRSSP